MTGTANRDLMLRRIREAVGASAEDAGREERARARLASPPVNLIPERARKPRQERLKLFADMLRGQGAQVTWLKSMDQAPEAVATYLRSINLPAVIRTGADEILASLPWKATSLERRVGRAQGDDTASLSRATAAAAETGTLFLLSSAANPTTLNFLPDTHIVVIGTDDIVGSYEEAWQRVRAIHGARTMPRTVNLISGPSRTADIEQTIVMGAHGPRRFHVIVVG